MNKVLRIAVTGPESTGKSWLSEKLARHYDTLYVPEFAREYVNQLDRPYRQDDIIAISREQIRREKQALTSARRYLFCDTELIVSKIWEVYKYGECHPWILEQIKSNPCDLYLLCNIDLPWEPDPLREYPHMRGFFFNWFKKELKRYGLPYRIISGNREQRLANAVAEIEEFFKAGK